MDAQEKQDFIRTLRMLKRISGVGIDYLTNGEIATRTRCTSYSRSIACSTVAMSISDEGGNWGGT